MKKLYAVTITLEMVEPVVATSEQEAEAIAADHIAEIVKNASAYDFTFMAIENGPNDKQFMGACTWPDAEEAANYLTKKE